jgi:hypothetical protein
MDISLNTGPLCELTRQSSVVAGCHGAELKKSCCEIAVFESIQCAFLVYEGESWSCCEAQGVLTLMYWGAQLRQNGSLPGTYGRLRAVAPQLAGNGPEKHRCVFRIMGTDLSFLLAPFYMLM